MNETSLTRTSTPTPDSAPAAPPAPASSAPPAALASPAGTRPRFDTKIAVLLREDLAGWQRLNVTAFLASGLGSDGAVPDVIGAPYEDADGTGYLPMFRQPVLVFQASPEVLGRARRRAVDRGLHRSVFTMDMFTTGGDVENRSVVRAVSGDRLDLAGVAVYGPRNAVDRVVKGARLHP